MDVDIAVTLFNAHISTHTADTGRHQGSDSSRSVQLVRPRVTQGMSMESWKSFQVLWRLYKTNTDLSEAESSLQLMYCCSEELREQLFRADPNVTAKQESEQLESIRKLAVVPSAIRARRPKMLSRSQEVGERPRGLFEGEQGKTATCEQKH